MRTRIVGNQRFVQSVPAAVGVVAVVGRDINDPPLAAVKAQQVDPLAADHIPLGIYLGSNQWAFTTAAATLPGAAS